MEDNKPPKIKNKFTQKVNGIELDKKDPIYDVMSEQEIDEASSRFEALLDEVDDKKI